MLSAGPIAVLYRSHGRLPFNIIARSDHLAYGIDSAATIEYKYIHMK
jgi:hypothetical protein